MIELTDIAYVRSGVADLDKAVSFGTEIVGLELVAPAAELVAPAADVVAASPRPGRRSCGRTGGTTASPWSRAGQA